MKFKALLLGMCCLGLGLSSCNLNNEDSDNYQTYMYQVCNLVIPVAGGNAFATPANYALTYYIYSGNVQVACTDLSLGIGTSSFTTTPIPYTVAAYGSTPNSYYEVTKFQNGVASDNGMYISNLSGFTSQWLNFLPSGVPNLQGQYLYQPRPALVMSYTANYDYRVQTFLPDAVYGGNTTVKAGPTTIYDGDETYYRVIFHTDMKQADIIFYNSKFAPTMPPFTFLVKNLDVVYGRSGYTIQIPEGTAYMVPEAPEGESGTTFTPYDSYHFTKLTLSPLTSDLTQAMILFDVQIIKESNPVATYNCSFTGAYCYSQSSSESNS